MIPIGRFLQVSEVAALAWIVSLECTFTTRFTFDISGGACYISIEQEVETTALRRQT
jgi:hypothetical protein